MTALLPNAYHLTALVQLHAVTMILRNWAVDLEGRGTSARRAGEPGVTSACATQVAARAMPRAVLVLNLGWA